MTSAGRCRVMVDPLVLRFWHSVPSQRDNPRRPDVRILRDRERNIPHPRIERAFQWTVQNSLGRDRANDRSTSVTDRAPTVGRNLLTRLADAAVAMARADGLHDRTRTQGHRAHSRRYQPQRRRRRHRAVCVVEDPPSRVINCEAPLAARRESSAGGVGAAEGIDVDRGRATPVHFGAFPRRRQQAGEYGPNNTRAADRQFGSRQNNAASSVSWCSAAARAVST